MQQEEKYNQNDAGSQTKGAFSLITRWSDSIPILLRILIYLATIVYSLYVVALASVGFCPISGSSSLLCNSIGFILLAPIILLTLLIVFATKNKDEHGRGNVLVASDIYTAIILFVTKEFITIIPFFFIVAMYAIAFPYSIKNRRLIRLLVALVTVILLGVIILFMIK